VRSASAHPQIAAATHAFSRFGFAPTTDVALKIITHFKEKLIKVDAKVVSHAWLVAFEMAEVAIPGDLFADILRRSRSCDRRP